MHAADGAHALAGRRVVHDKLGLDVVRVATLAGLTQHGAAQPEGIDHQLHLAEATKGGGGGGGGGSGCCCCSAATAAVATTATAAAAVAAAAAAAAAVATAVVSSNAHVLAQGCSVAERPRPWGWQRASIARLEGNAGPEQKGELPAHTPAGGDDDGDSDRAWPLPRRLVGG